MTMTMGRMTANATIASTVSPAWYARAPATSAVTLMISSRRPSIAGVANTRVSAKRGSATQTAASVARTACPGSIGILPSSGSMPKATGTKQITAGSARTRVRRVAAMPRWGERSSGSTVSATSTPRTTTTATFGRLSAPNVVTTYQAGARAPKTQRRTVGAVRAGCEPVLLSTGFSSRRLHTACAARTARDSREGPGTPGRKTGPARCGRTIRGSTACERTDRIEKNLADKR